MAVLFQQALIQAAAVDADADGNAPVLADVHNGLDPVLAADVAGVDADLGCAALGCCDGQLIVEMDVSHQRQRTFLADFCEAPCALHVGHSETDHLTARSVKLADLLQRACHVGGLGVEHGLDDHGGAAADGHTANIDLSGHKVHPLKITKISLNMTKAISASSRTMPAMWR